MGVCLLSIFGKLLYGAISFVCSLPLRGGARLFQFVFAFPSIRNRYPLDVIGYSLSYSLLLLLLLFYIWVCNCNCNDSVPVLFCPLLRGVAFVFAGFGWCVVALSFFLSVVGFHCLSFASPYTYMVFLLSTCLNGHVVLLWAVRFRSALHSVVLFVRCVAFASFFVLALLIVFLYVCFFVIIINIVIIS